MDKFEVKDGVARSTYAIAQEIGYKDNIDVYNLRYFNISTKDIKIISVEKINKKSIENE